MKRVYFDESGNTGQNLLDEADPIFVLASCSFQAGEEQELASHFRQLPQFNLPELKFKSLRKSPAGQRAVLTFLNSAAVTSATAAAVVFHKPYMVVTKYCDLVLEPSMRKAGVDFYARGLNIATANLLTTTMPVFLNPRTWSDFLALFVRVVRERSPILFNLWRQSAELIHSHLELAQSEMAHNIAPVLLMDSPDEFLRTLSDDELDPFVSAYHFMAGHWGQMLGSSFDLIADDSKVVTKQRERLLKLSDPNLNDARVGHDRRTIEYPLKVADIIEVDSMIHRQVQIADILAGAIACAAKARVKAPLQQGTFAHDIFAICFEKGLIINGLWPSHVLDPKQLGTDIEPNRGDMDAATYAAMVLHGHPATKKGNMISSFPPTRAGAHCVQRMLPTLQHCAFRGSFKPVTS